MQLFTMTELVHAPPSPGSRSPKPSDYLHDPAAVARETCEEVSSLHMLSSNGSPAVQSAVHSSVASPRCEAPPAPADAALRAKSGADSPGRAGGTPAGGATEKEASHLRALNINDRSNSVVSCASCAASDYGQAE